MENEKFETPIGTKEPEKLQAKKVQVVGKKIEMQTNKEKTKEYGERLTLICKHPDREETIDIFKVKYLKNDKVTIAGLWYNLDEDKKICKLSALAETMRKYNVETITGFEDQELDTTEDERGYLCVKAY